MINFCQFIVWKSQFSKHSITEQYAHLHEKLSYYQVEFNIIWKYVGRTLQAVGAMTGAEHGVKVVGSSRVTCQYSRTRLWELRCMKHLACSFRCFVIPMNCSLLTITLYSSIRTTVVYNITKYSVPSWHYNKVHLYGELALDVSHTIQTTYPMIRNALKTETCGHVATCNPQTDCDSKNNF